MAKKKDTAENTIKSEPEIPAIPDPPSSTIVTELVQDEKPPEQIPLIQPEPSPVIVDLPSSDAQPGNLLTPEFPEQETEEQEQEKRGRGRPKGSKTKTSSIISEVEKPINYGLMAEAIFDMSTGILAGSFGPEWSPRSPEERGHVCISLANYFKAKEVKDIPPGLMLTIVVVAYCAPRLKEPGTAGKIKACWFWVRSKISRKKIA